MQKCKVISIKKIGKKMTYGVTMKSDQHNYRLVTDVNDRCIGVYSKNSHSAAYSFLAYQTAFLKYYYPLEFMCNLLTSEIDNNDKNKKLNEYMGAAKKMDVNVSLPNINKSKTMFIIDKEDNREVLRIPLTIINGIGSKAVDNIVSLQPFKNFEDFVSRIDHRVVNSRVIENLTKNGVFYNTWKISKDNVIRLYVEIKKQIEIKKKQDKKEKLQKEKQREQGSLFDDADQIKL